MTCAALLHDAVEDHASGIAPGSPDNALSVLATRFGGRVAALVAAVTNPDYRPGRDEHQQYREHVTASLQASPWARVIKASDFTDNAIGIIHVTGAKLSRLAVKYSPLVPVLRELILRPDTPLDADVKVMISGQLDTAQGPVRCDLARAGRRRRSAARPDRILEAEWYPALGVAAGG